jgi:hypothetical protein
MKGDAQLIPHCDTATKKGQNRGHRIIAVLTQLSGQYPAGFFPIAEHQATALL